MNSLRKAFLGIFVYIFVKCNNEYMYKYVGTYVFILGASTSVKQIAIAKEFQEENNPTKEEKRREEHVYSSALRNVISGIRKKKVSFK